MDEAATAAIERGHLRAEAEVDRRRQLRLQEPWLYELRRRYGITDFGAGG